jgi:hypothetical protein
MKQATVKTSRAITIVTSITLVLATGFVVAAVFQPALWVATAIIVLVCAGCYLWAPEAYELSGGQLVVLLRAGRKQFGPVTGCSRITERLPCTLRLFGNGGLFAGVGVFWNRKFGTFRMYVTSARYQDWVLVETSSRKIVISPEDPKAFVDSWNI